MTLETFLDDLCDYMEDNGIPGVVVSDNYDSFGNDIILTPYGGISSLSVVSGPNPIGMDFQLMIKNNDQEQALAYVFKLMRLLGDVSNAQIGDTFFLFIQLKYGMFSVGKTNSMYYQYTLNFSLLMR